MATANGNEQLVRVIQVAGTLGPSPSEQAMYTVPIGRYALVEIIRLNFTGSIVSNDYVRVDTDNVDLGQIQLKLNGLASGNVGLGRIDAMAGSCIDGLTANGGYFSNSIMLTADRSIAVRFQAGGASFRFAFNIREYSVP